MTVMKIQRKALLALTLLCALTIATGCGGGSATSTPTPTPSPGLYRVVLLHPVGFQDTFVRTNQAGALFGSGRVSTSSAFHALLWNGRAASVVDLHPSGYTSSGIAAILNDTYVGRGEVAGESHALLWNNGSATNVVDLHPAGARSSALMDLAVDSNNIPYQVGYLSNTDIVSPRATLWRGTAASAVSLQPTGYTYGFVSAASTNYQVGYVSNSQGGSPLNSRPFLWSGTAASGIDLTPTGYKNGTVNDTTDDTQVGYVFRNGVGQTPHAMLWHGTAASGVDLHSTAYQQTEADGVSGNTQVGSGTIAGGGWHALVWNGTPESLIDLHSTTTGLKYNGQTLNGLGSKAHSIDANGNIAGTVFDDRGFNYAVLWIKN